MEEAMPTATELKELIAALAPGLIILSIRQWFITTREGELKAQLLYYAAVSAVYYAIANPLFSALGQFVPKIYSAFGRLPPNVAWISEAAEYVVLPALIGLLLAVATFKDWFSKFWRILKLNPIHHSPTAWDYAFQTMKNQEFILVTMNDGSIIGGVYGGDESFSSSVNEQRDLLIGEIYEEREDGTWGPGRLKKSILICGKDVRFVEFFHGENHDHEETHHDHSTATQANPGSAMAV